YYIPASALQEGTTYYWKVQAFNNSTNPVQQGQYSEVWHFTTEISLLPPPTLTSPANGASNVSLQPTLDWLAVAGANRYWVLVATDPAALPTDPYAPSCPGCVFDGYTSDTYYIPASALQEGTTYYWKVQAFNNSTNPVQQGQYSEVWHFTTESASPDTLSVFLSADPSGGTAPLNNVDLTARVSGSASGSINYTFYCDRSDSGTNITPGWAAKFDGVFDNPKTAVDVCDYSAAGAYTVKVIAERGSAPPAEDRVTIVVDPQGSNYSIFGYVRDSNGNPIPGVVISAGAGGSATTDASGAYTISGLTVGTYTLIPSKSGWTFTPTTRTVSVPPDAPEQDFTGSSSRPIPSGSLTLLVASSIPLSSPLAATAQVRNTGTSSQEFTLTARLRQDSTILSTQTFTLSLASGAIADRTVDFGLRPTGRYRVESTLSAGGTTLVTQSRDVTVANPNASRIILDYAGDLKAAAHAELDDIAYIPSWALSDEVVSLGLDAIEDYAVDKFADFAAPIQDAGGIPRSTSDDAIAQIRDKLGRARQHKRNLSTAVRLFVRDGYGVTLPDGFDPLNPDLDFITDPILKDRIKKAIAGYLEDIFNYLLIGPLWVNAPRSEVDARHDAFEDFVVSYAVAEPEGLAIQMKHGWDRVINVVESDAVVTLGPHNILGHTLQYDLTLQEQENKRQQIDIAKDYLPIVLVLLVIAGLILLLLPAGWTLAAVFATVIWRLVKILTLIAKYKILELAAAFVALSMLFTVSKIAPHVPQYQDETLNAAEALIGGSGMARLHSFDVAIQPGQAGLTTQVTGPETGQSQVLVETALYSVDGRIINIIWSPLQVQAGQQATLSKDVPLAPGTYRAVTTLYAEGDVVAAEGVPFDVPGPGVKLTLSLEQPRLGLGDSLQAQVTLTNTSTISDVNDLTLIVESADGVNFDAWPVSLAAGATQQIDYTFTPTATGSYVLRAWLGIGLNMLAQQDVAYIVGSGPAIALNTSTLDIYTPGLTVTLPLTLSNVGDTVETVIVT
ncbi:MAG: carboxypeptidase regulatory-like domain-containing protein, partial [Chloroflexota bacterium]|nr:carboxypeptidase regulatory-like domain-containing protein [Chloroflexota bacterium]